MPKVKFTSRGIDAIRPPQSGRVEYWDSIVTGLGLRVSETNRRSWVVMYRQHGRLRRMTLGTYPKKSMAAARDEAKKIFAAVASGEDPASEKNAERKADSFKELANLYIELYAKENKKSWKFDQELINRDLLPSLGSKRAHDVNRRDVVAILDRMVRRGAPVGANRTLAVLRKMYSWAIMTGRVEMVANPCFDVPKPTKTTSRERVLKDNEIQKFWGKLPEVRIREHTRLALKFLLITGQRRGEAAKMRWSEVDQDNWTIPAENSKNGKTHIVPLSRMALDTLSKIMKLNKENKKVGDKAPVYVFPSSRSGKHIGPSAISHAISNNLEEFDLPHFTVHDLRRTAATNFGKLKVPRLVVVKTLNQSDSSITATYDRHDYLEEKREALQSWSDRLEIIVSDVQQKEISNE
jgi:integrase